MLSVPSSCRPLRRFSRAPPPWSACLAAVSYGVRARVFWRCSMVERGLCESSFPKPEVRRFESGRGHEDGAAPDGRAPGQITEGPSGLCDRFWSKVDRSGGPAACWLWKGPLTGAGYGTFTSGSRTDGSRRIVGAHRFALEQKLGRRLLPGMSACHDCPDGDRRDCVNPSHIFEGTAGDNSRDAVAKGRQDPCRGEANGMAKLTEADIPVIRRRRASGETAREIASDYDISWSLVYQIDWGIAWAHVSREVTP